MITEIEFKSLANKGFNRIPLIVETLADLETPLTIYLKLAKKHFSRKNTFLLESVFNGKNISRYSFIGLPTSTKIESYGDITNVVINNKIVESVKCNAFDFIYKFQSRYKVAILPDIPYFCGGLVGYFGYNAISYIEKKIFFNKNINNNLFLPDIQLLLTEEIIVIDNLFKKLYLVVYSNPNIQKAFYKSCKRIDYLLKLLHNSINIPIVKKSLNTKKKYLFNKENYIKAVLKAKEYILSGDIMQIQISQCTKKLYINSALDLYRSLRVLNPSPYMYFYDFGEFQIVGSSPEILVKNKILKNNSKYKKITIRPIAGTKPRGVNKKSDKLLAIELLSDPKEIAEHVMLIDLARNDISRISIVGSIKITEKMVIEKYSHVQHIVSNIEGILKNGLSNFDILKATFPSGTLSGAPKIRAIELINEIEPMNRGIYGGACGYLSFNGEMDIAILIRTGIIKNRFLYVQSAAGIVYDSIPEIEWQETKNKAKALLNAARKVQNGLF